MGERSEYISVWGGGRTEANVGGRTQSPVGESGKKVRMGVKIMHCFWGVVMQAM